MEEYSGPYSSKRKVENQSEIKVVDNNVSNQSEIKVDGEKKKWGGSIDHINKMGPGELMTAEELLIFKKYSTSEIYYILHNDKIYSCKVIGGNINIIYGIGIERIQQNSLTVELQTGLMSADRYLKIDNISPNKLFKTKEELLSSILSLIEN